VKIAFFSKDGDSGVTSNLSAISIAGILGYDIKILTMENHWSRDSIARYLMYEKGPNIVKEGDVRYLSQGILENLVMHFSDCTKKRRTDTWTIEVIQDSLYYLPQNAYTKDVFDYEFCSNVLPRIKSLEKAYDLVLIDTKNYTMNSKVILDEADLVVVNLRQDFDDIEAFFSFYSAIAYKSLFLISDYYPNKSCNLNKIRTQFNLNKNNVVAVSHNPQFESALTQGKIINYMYVHFQCDRGDLNYCFIRDIKKATKMIIQNAQELSCVAGGSECN
jgi:hypothetical protein